MIEFRGACARHRAALLDFVDHGEIVAGTAPALAHLERCERCTDELESTVLAITALRRFGDELARAEPSPEAWPRLRARIETLRPARWAIMSPSAGMVMSIALVAVLVAPFRVGTSTAELGAHLSALEPARRLPRGAPGRGRLSSPTSAWARSPRRSRRAGPW